MKYLSLHIKNIASIEKVDLHFDKEPFCGNPIFLICGETGSGKSTILDAICLALYANTPRINNSANISKQSEDEVGFRDVKQLMRRGEDEASAELRFIGNDGETYIAQWSARRKRTGKIEDSRSLECPMKGLFLNKKKEIETEIERCVGMKYEQFCRTSLLAQGEFTKFLSSNEKEKSDILEKLTGTEIYSQIGITIFEKAKEAKKACEDEAKKIEGYEILTEEETNLKKEELHHLNERQEKVKAAQKQTEKTRNWLMEQHRLQQELTVTSQKLASLKEECASPEFIRRMKNISEWESTIEVRNEMQQLGRREEEFRALAEKERTLRETFRLVCGGITWVKEQLHEKRANLHETTRELERRKEASEMYEAYPSIQENLNGYLSARKEATACLAEAKRIESDELPNIQKTIDEIVKKRSEYEEKGKEIQHEIETRMKEVKEKDLNRLNVEMQTLQQLENDCTQQQREREQLRTLQAKIAELNKKADQLTRQLPLEKEAYQKQVEDEQKHEKSLRTLRLAVGDAIKEVRNSLSIGDECPICGKKIDSIVKESHLEAAIAPYEKELEEIRQAREKALRRLTGNEKALEQATKEEKELTEESPKCAATIQQRDEMIQRMCEKLSLNPKEGKIIDSIVKKRIQKEKERKSVLAIQETIAQLQKEKDNLVRDLNQAKELAAETEKKASAAKERIAQYRSAAQTHEGNAQKRHQAAASKIKRSGWEEDITTFLRTLEQEVREYQELLQRKEKGEKEVSQWEASLETIEGEQNWIQQEFPEWESEGKSIQTDQLTQRTSQLAKECSSLKSGLRNNQEEKRKLTQKINDFIKENSHFTLDRLTELQRLSKEENEVAKKQMEEQKSQIDRAEGALKSLNQRIEETKAEKPEGITSETTLETLQTEMEQIEAETKEIIESTAKIELEFKRSEENIRKVAEVRKNVEKLREEWSKWDILNQHFGSSDGKSFRLIAQSYVLRQLLHNANAFLKRLNDRYELSCNSRSLGIWVRDLYMGGNVRPCNTLSGGESFIISLALALGLSTLNRSRLTTDIVFIDEGFGTLSADYLDAVMNMLEKLHNLGGKKVGIISHVEILKERIPTQIRISKKGLNGCSEVKVC